MLGTTCTTDEQTRMVAAFVECIVSSQRQTFNKQVHKYGYIILHCILKEVNTLSGKKIKVDLEEMTFILVEGRIQSVGWEV